MNNMQTFIGTGILAIIRNDFGYYLEGFHVWFPCHNLVPSFTELPVYENVTQNTKHDLF